MFVQVRGRRKYQVSIKYCFISRNKKAHLHICQKNAWKGEMRRQMDLQSVADKGHFIHWKGNCRCLCIQKKMYSSMKTLGDYNVIMSDLVLGKTLFDYSLIKFRSQCWITVNQKSHCWHNLINSLFHLNHVLKKKKHSLEVVDDCANMTECHHILTVCIFHK